jgi:transposase InsO family protein
MKSTKNQKNMRKTKRRIKNRKTAKPAKNTQLRQRTVKYGGKDWIRYFTSVNGLHGGREA